MRRFLCLFAAALLLPLPCFGESETPDAAFAVEDENTVFPPEEYEFDRRDSVRYESDTLIYTIESLRLDGTLCLLTKVWVQNPLRQIRKVNASWGESLSSSLQLFRQLPEAVLGTNASGYISKAYPELPEGYPGESSDYYYTTLGSLVITEGEVLRKLEEVPFWGLSLSDRGITLHRGSSVDSVMALSPRQTWAFFEPCAMQVNGEDTLPEKGSWTLADAPFPRSVIARVNRNNYLMLHVPNREDSYGLSLHRINKFFFSHFRTEWVYCLDGGYSSALIYREKKKNARPVQIAPGRQQVADILCFTE